MIYYLEVNLSGVFEMLMAIIFGPAILLAILGFVLKSRGKLKGAKTSFILAGVYLLISLGICGTILLGS